jgi:predicted amidohydrolase YtcJ|tara:strand:+ start:683 stop:2368 length:1686 start_codon:yes stop_codon:yes gene_type:complete
MNVETIIIINGHVQTLDEQSSTAEAIFIKNNKIHKVGSESEILKLKEENTKVISANGGTIMPGFIDSHVHLFPGADGLNKLDLMQINTFDELKSSILNQISQNPAGSFIFGRGANYKLFSESDLKSRKQLDQVSTSNPILLQAPDGHTAWANTKALSDANVLNGVSLPVGHEVLMSSDGLAEGMLKENEAIRLVLTLQGSNRARVGLDTGEDPHPPATNQERLNDIEVLKNGLSHLAKLGVTSIHNMDGNFYTLELLEEIRNKGNLTCRVKVPFHYKTEMGIEKLELASKMNERWDDDFLSSGLVKFFMDGVLDSGTAFLIDDYADTPGHKGDALFDEELFNALSKDVDRRGLQIAVHSIGDAAVRRVLNAYTYARDKNGIRDSRHRVEHIELIQENDIPKFKKLGVIASMQPVHPPGSDGLPLEPTISKIGPQRFDLAYAWRSIKDAGGKVTFSTDWPVSNVNPINAISNALNRKVWTNGQKDQRLSLIETLKAYTIEGAYAEFKEQKKGKLKEGYLADIVILSDRIDLLDTSELSTLIVTHTIVDGKLIFSSNSISTDA